MAVLVEICVGDSQSASAAEQGGADRIELCADLAAGGTTPSAGTITIVCRTVAIPVHVLIRPRAGDFILATSHMDIMLEDIEVAKRAGARGVVLGAIQPDRTIDVLLMEFLIRESRPMSITFHRAFDATRDPFEALDSLIELGVDRVLTSGSHATALEGRSELAHLVAHARGRIAILAGGGINARNVAELVGSTGVQEIHAGSAVSQPTLSVLSTPKPEIIAANFAWELPYQQTNAGLVAELVQAVRGIETEGNRW